MAERYDRALERTIFISESWVRRSYGSACTAVAEFARLMESELPKAWCYLCLLHTYVMRGKRTGWCSSIQ